jgi:hypothetical protein
MRDEERGVKAGRSEEDDDEATESERRVSS